MSSSDIGGSVASTLRENDFKQRGGTVYSVSSTQGTYTYYHDQETSCIWLQWVKSYSPGNGFGTEVMKNLMALSNEKKCPGDVRLDACYSSHLFYLFMGMIPEDQPRRYTLSQYGDMAAESLLELEKIKTEKAIQAYIDYDKGDVIDKLKQVLREEKGIPKSTEISHQELLNNREFLLSLNNKKVSFLTDIFIPNILSLFERHLKQHTSEKYPNTSSWSPVQMVFSDEGKKRWFAALKDNKAFVPFKKLEHLIPYMNDQQKLQWDAILKKMSNKNNLNKVPTLFAEKEQKKVVTDPENKPPEPK